MKKWEYLAEYSEDDDVLDQRGLEGWELVAVTPGTEERCRAFYFKRPVK